MTNSKFSTLLEQSVSLTNSQLQSGVAMEEDFVQLQRPLDQLELQSKKLWQKSSRSRDLNGDARAQMLLAGHGFDSERVSQTLQAIQLAQAFEPMQPLEDSDVEGFLRNEHEIILCQTIEDMRNQTMTEYSAFFERSIQEDWEKAKNIVFESLARIRVSEVDNDSSFSRMKSVGMPHIDFSQSSPVAETSSFAVVQPHESSAPQIKKMDTYANAVSCLNESRLKNQRLPVCKLFGDSLKDVEGIRSDQLQMAWKTLSCVIGETAGSLTSSPLIKGKTEMRCDDKFVRERGFASAYSASFSDSSFISYRKWILEGSRRWLQSHFLSYLNDHVDRILKLNGSAMISSKMTLLNKLLLWIKEVIVNPGNAASCEIVDGQPFWAVIFYLIRAGNTRDALEYAAQFERYLSKTERRFLDFLTAWVENRDLPHKLKQELLQDFNSSIRDNLSKTNDGSFTGRRDAGLFSAMSSVSVDSYKYLVYRIIGRILLEDVSIPLSVVKSLPGGRLGWEDELWFQLMLAKEEEVSSKDIMTSPATFHFADESLSNDYFSLYSVFQKLISVKPVDYWTSNGRDHYRYFVMLILVGEFERAVHHLWSNGCEVDALHFAVALSYYGLLRIPSDVDTMETDIASEQCDVLVIHFSRMIDLYLTRFFNRSLNPFASAHYAFLLCFFADGFIGLPGRKFEETSSSLLKKCYNLLIDIILQSGKIDDFLGSLGTVSAIGKGYRTSAFLDKYLPLIFIHSWDEFKDKIIKAAALKCVKFVRAVDYNISSIEDEQIDKTVLDNAEFQEHNAILLFNLAEEYDQVLSLLWKKISFVLGQNDLEEICMMVVGVFKKSSLIITPPFKQKYIDKLSQVQLSAEGALNYYLERPQISVQLSSDHKKTCSDFITLCAFFKTCYDCSISFIKTHGTTQGYTQMDVNVAGSGYRVKIGDSSCSGWKKGLLVLDKLGIIPKGLSTFDIYDDRSESPFSRIDTPHSKSQEFASSFAGKFGHNNNGLQGSTNVIDFSKVSAKADQIRKEFSESVLLHLPSILLAAELLLFIGWHEVKVSSTSEWKEFSAIFSNKSRQIMAYVSAVSRWFKIPSETHRLLSSLDEYMLQ